jgi:peptidoglycan-N-acetylglucosamine deacetylase
MRSDIAIAPSDPETSPPSRRVYLTFDDGPHPRHTANILDALADRGVHATFFVLGVNVQHAGTAILRRARAEGHWIGNHGFSHQDLTAISESQMRQEIMRTESLISEVLGPGKVFRPPYGAWNATVDRAIEELGYRKILWDVEARDWDPAYQPDGWVGHTIDQIRGRQTSVVLAHDIHQTTADHLLELLRRIEGIGGMIANLPASP